MFILTAQLANLTLSVLAIFCDKPRWHAVISAAMLLLFFPSLYLCAVFFAVFIERQSAQRFSGLLASSLRT